MALRGERFHIDLSFDDDGPPQKGSRGVSSTTPILVGDILEKAPGNYPMPTAPSLKAGSGGFPVHKKRGQFSKFKQRRAQGPEINASTSADSILGRVRDEQEGADERSSIDLENRQRLAAMSDEEVEKERQELMSNLDPSLIEKLMKHSSVKSSDLKSFQKPDGKPAGSSKKVSFDMPKSDRANGEEKNLGAVSEPRLRIPGANGSSECDSKRNEAKRNVSNPDEGPATAAEAPEIHFPQARHPPSLDPSSPSFFSDLHSKYFPSLPIEPDKLAWMSSKPASDSPYLSNTKTLPVSAIRFSFDGNVIAPGTAQAIPVTKGLHHHGQAPESAGYTIPELAYLARSAFPAQRCIAYQTLGRILYRLGKGEYDTLSEGLWKCIEDGRVLDSLQEEAGKTGGHMSAKAYATEALWLWSRGGGSLRKAK